MGYAPQQPALSKTTQKSRLAELRRKVLCTTGKWKHTTVLAKTTNKKPRQTLNNPYPLNNRALLSAAGPMKLPHTFTTPVGDFLISTSLPSLEHLHMPQIKPPILAFDHIFTTNNCDTQSRKRSCSNEQQKSCKKSCCTNMSVCVSPLSITFKINTAVIVPIITYNKESTNTCTNISTLFHEITRHATHLALPTTHHSSPAVLTLLPKSN